MLEDGLAAQEDGPGIDWFQVIDDSQEGAFSGTAGTDNNDHLTLFDLQRDAAQHVQATEVLVHVLDADHVRAWRAANKRKGHRRRGPGSSSCGSAFSRRSSRSMSTAHGQQTTR